MTPACLFHIFKVSVLMMVFVMMTFVTYCIISIYFSICEWTPFLTKAREVLLDGEECYV